MDANPPSVRKLVQIAVTTVCVLLLIHGFFLEPFQVPTGSMAPALVGHHRSVVCPQCQFVVDVGRAASDLVGTAGARHYSKAACPNCGCVHLNVGAEPEAQGDHVLVNKSLYALRRPRRWEVVVFRLFGKVFIKRIVGLGGEEIAIADGDIYIDGQLLRKTLEEVSGMRILVFDNDHAPAAGWNERWQYQPKMSSQMAGQPLAIDGRAGRQALTYQHFFGANPKCEPIRNEYGYNAGTHVAPEPVHDFVAEADVEVVEGSGRFSIALTDGGTQVAIELETGEPGALATGELRNQDVRSLTLPARHGKLELGQRHHLEVALVDRRFSARLDGRDLVTPVDLPALPHRQPVIRPMQFQADGVLARLHHVQLYRDIHYGQAGKNAVHGRSVRLGIDQTFVLGDNSPNSEDSRFWPDSGAVPVENLIGRAFLVHLPSRVAGWELGGAKWRWQVLDSGRVRWLR